MCIGVGESVMSSLKMVRAVGQRRSRNSAKSERGVRRWGQSSQQAPNRTVAMKGREGEAGTGRRHGVKRKDFLFFNERFGHV